MNSKFHVLETEPTKINDSFYSKINKSKYNNIEMISGCNKPSSQILSTYYSNKNQLNKISIKKNKNFNINFNNNSPNSKNTSKAFSKNGRNMNLILNNNNMNISNNNINISNNNINTKYQSFSNINKIVNRDFHDFPDLSIHSINKKKIEISTKNKQNSQNYTKVNNLYLNRPLSSYNSNIYSKTENNINCRNNSNINNRHKYNTNYNLINISSPKNRSNTHSNINSFQKTPKINNLNEQNIITPFGSQSNYDIQNLKKISKKTKNSYSFSQNDNKMDKIDKMYLNQFYEKAFNNSKDNKIHNNKNEDKNKNNNEDFYKENSTTNQSTYTNCSNKIKNLKKTDKFLNQKLVKKNIDNFEELHFFIVTSLQNGKKLSTNFN
jgi:hypothetical protein